jgi:hypothetical protein
MLLFDRMFSRRYSFIVFIILASTLLADIAILRSYDLFNTIRESRTVLFAIISLISLICQIYMIFYVIFNSRANKESNVKRSHLFTTLVVVGQVSLALVIVLVLSEVSLGKYYRTLLVQIAIVCTVCFSVIFLSVLSFRFIKWFSSNRTLLILMYALVAVSLLLNSFFTNLYIVYLLNDKPAEIRPYIYGASFSIRQDLAVHILKSGYEISSILSFILTWVATAIILKHYSSRLGRFKYWMLVSLPLIFFLSQFIGLFFKVFPLLMSTNVVLSIFITFVFSLSKSVGGVLFGAAFWSVTKSIQHETVVTDNLIICAYGFVFFFIASQSISLVYAPYPPFGLSAISFFALASYCILTGISYTSVSISSDLKLRTFIRKSVAEEFDLFSAIAKGDIQEIYRKKISDMARKLARTSELEKPVPPSMGEDDIKKYVDQVINEISHEKNETN